jgi:hypothetical protein
MSEETLKAFGEVVRSIRRVCQDNELSFWSFIYHLSTNHADILGVRLAPGVADRCAEVLARASPPKVKVEESEQSRMMPELEER